jgi:oligosaccharide repeat unit polymerase
VILASLAALFCIIFARKLSGAHTPALILSPVALIGWFGLLYVSLFGLALRAGIDTKWAPYINQLSAYEHGIGSYLAFCTAGIAALFLVRPWTRKRQKPLPPLTESSSLRFTSLLLLAISAASFAYLVSKGALVLSFDASDYETQAIENKYALAAVDLAIPGLALLASRIGNNWKRKYLFLALVGLSAIAFLLLGGRYRIAMLITLLVFLVISKQAPLNRLEFLGLGSILCVLLPAMSVGRSYRSGFNLQSAISASTLESLTALANEGNIFLAMGSVAQYVPEFRPFDPISPFIVAMASPIPRAIWHNKPEPEYLSVIPAALDSPALERAGAALPIFGEWYLMAGFTGIILIGMLVIAFLQLQYIRALQQGRLPVAAAISCFCAYAYTRGYLSQNITAYCFIVIPAVALLKYPLPRRNRSEYRQNSELINTKTPY